MIGNAGDCSKRRTLFQNIVIPVVPGKTDQNIFADHMLYFDCGDGEDVSIPFDPEHIERSDPALIYNLHNPQTTITGVDFTSEWTIYHSPEDEGDEE